MTAPSQLRLLTLNEGENSEVTLFRLERGWTLHFVCGPSIAAKKVRVFTNHPLESKAGPNRNLYREIEWQNMSGSRSDVYDNFGEVRMVLAGSFNYYFTVDGSKDQKNASGCGYFLVDPILRVGKYDERLPLDCITCQTVLAKSLGPFDSWENRLLVAKESGYNMVHFTPIQELGGSNSCYSLKDQLKLNPVFSPGDSNYTMDDVDHLVQKMKNEWDLLSLTDLVFNHTANESPWIQEHPECVYNLVNSPHLKPAYLLDRILWYFSEEVSEGIWSKQGVPLNPSTEEHLTNIRVLMTNEILPRHNISQFYLLHVDDTVMAFRNAIASGVVGARFDKDLEIIPDPKYRRLKAAINIAHAIHLFYDSQPDYLSHEDQLNSSCGALRSCLEVLNGAKHAEIQSHLDAAVDNFIANVRWRFVDEHGDKLGCVDHSIERPLMFNYFILPKMKMTMAEEEKRIEGPEAAFCMAHNGWVMNDDPLRNFAEPGSNIYLRRELIPWGDSVKLRYGKSKDDCPYLWNHMRQYVCDTARIFHGVRLDNCHSTPIHVAEYMLDEARKIRPDLYVIAELFTSSEQKDNTFINRLGLNSLIREALSAWNSHEQGRLVHRYGGNPVGAFMMPPARNLVPSLAHAIFLDQTHDNPSPIQKRTVLDVLPSTALVAMACCATGSNRGYDELVPHHINVVTEPRIYQSWTKDAKPPMGRVNHKTGIIAAKHALNSLHQTLSQTGFSQLFVDQVDGDTVSITRHNPVSHQSVILVARTVFSEPQSMDTNYSDTLSIPGIIEEVILEASLSPVSGAATYERDDEFINGLPGYSLHHREHFDVTDSNMVEVKVTSSESVQELEFVQFPPGSVIAFKVCLNPTVKGHILKVRQALSHFGFRMRTISGRNLDEIRGGSTLEDILADMNLNDLSRALYRCDAEEKDDGKGFGAYDIPGHGPMVYCGLQGVVSLLNDIRLHNNLGHPLCENLRNGNWLMDYTANRLLAFPGTQPLGEWLAQVFSHLKEAPRYLVPCYFDAVVKGVHMLLMEVSHAKMSSFIRDGPSFLRHLASGSLQFCSFVPTARLPHLSPNLAPPLPESCHNHDTGLRDQCCVTISAGLPHFSSGIFRNWGRDTFISLRGLMLLPGRFDEARYIILAYAACLRHGLIPNLLGSGTEARYNCRDAVWWWLQCLQDYTNMAPNGTAILTDKVSRMYPTDCASPENPGIYEQNLTEVIQEAFQRHAEGIEYREKKAGPEIDNDMVSQGFNVNVGVDWETGFVFGGNEHNCGTWMDKNGSSEAAGNKGKPATPRDGSAVELVGLCRSALRWLAGLHGSGLYPYPGVKVTTNEESRVVTWVQWGAKIEDNFERFFWVSTEPDPEYEPRADLINRRGMYKDSVGASQCWADYQLRPNFPIAMVVAPELFNPEHAWQALTLVRDVLVGPLGMKTLDPSDWSYNGNYVNSDDSNDPKRARGFNYHQGPEWLWPIGFFMRAMLRFALALTSSQPDLVDQTTTYIKAKLSSHNVHLHASPWKSLPELTNQNGTVCHDSCPAQAWSMACILEVLYDMEVLTRQ